MALALLLAAVGAARLAMLSGETAAPALHAEPLPQWIDVPRPLHIFDLGSPLLRGLPLVYVARRSATGEGRQDGMAFGTPGLDALALRLHLTRGGDSAAPPQPLFAAVALQAAEAGLAVSRSGLADLLPTRFGRFEIAEVILAGATSRPVPCSGFRLALVVPSLTIGGFACGAPGKPVSRANLACLIDRLDLASGGEDRALIDVFAASEHRRDPGCSGARLAPDGARAAWLDDKPVTHVKTARRH